MSDQAGGRNVPNPPIPAGRYAAWCFDPLTEIDPGTGAMYGGYLHSSCDPNLNQSLPNHPGVAVSQDVWKS